MRTLMKSWSKTSPLQWANPQMKVYNCSNYYIHGKNNLTKKKNTNVGLGKTEEKIKNPPSIFENVYSPLLDE
jgi:hypothetical protein